jgi:hypothetical protein
MTKICANCTKELKPEVVTGESSLYSPGEEFILCEECFLTEEMHIEVSGTNNHPDLVETYRANLQGFRDEEAAHITNQLARDIRNSRRWARKNLAVRKD